MTTKEAVLDIIDTVRNRNDACQYTAGLIEWFVKLIDDESSPVSDGWIPVSEYRGWDVITYNVEYDPQEHRTNEWIWIHYDNEFWKISNTATHYKPLPNPPTSHK